MSSVYLGGYSAAAIKPPSQMQVLAMNASSAAGRLQALFQIRLNSSAAAAGQNPTSYIYAVGKLGSTGTIQKHDDTQVMHSHLIAGKAHALLQDAEWTISILEASAVLCSSSWVHALGQQLSLPRAVGRAGCPLPSLVPSLEPRLVGAQNRQLQAVLTGPVDWP